jgi:hypothetical protein
MAGLGELAGEGKKREGGQGSRGAQLGGGMGSY